MKKIIIGLLIACAISCRDEGVPDVSGISVDLQVHRFEKDFFSIDTNNLFGSLQQVQNKYPVFLQDFIINILGLPPLSDTSTLAQGAIRKFIHDYKPIRDSSEKIFSDFNKFEKEIRKGLQLVKYYFPTYTPPKKLITFIGPIDAYYETSLGGQGDVITTDALAIGLQLHLGKDFSLYKSEMGQALYPTYISRRFGPEYIPVNCMKNITDDLFADKSSSKALIIQMVEKGKRLFILDKLLPDLPDTLKIGYTDAELKGCYKNEGFIWNFFVTNGLVYNIDPGIIKNYIGDSPSTPEFGEGAPGNIGLFVGWQIVKKYMANNPSLQLTDLMRTDAKKIFEESKYRPK